MYQRSDIFVAILIISFWTFGAWGDIHCSSTTSAQSCPDYLPVCCFVGDESVGCCPQGTVCNEATGGCDQAPRLPPNQSEVSLTETQTVVYISRQTLFIAVGCLVGLGLFVLSSCFLVSVFASWWREFRTNSTESDCPVSDEEDDGAVLMEGDVTPLVISKVDPGLHSRCVSCKCPIDCVLMDCGHAIVCHACSRRLCECPQCGNSISLRKKVYVV